MDLFVLALTGVPATIEPIPMPDQSSAATEHAILQEITAPLANLPDDPLSVVEADFATALRGYDRVAVDEYVRQTRRLVAELQATRTPEAAIRRALERVGEQISGILQRAHETAEQITTQSRREASDRIDEARAEAEQLAAAAEQRVRDLDADTDRIWIERERIVADAEDLAAQLQALAKAAGQRFPSDEEASDEALVAGTPVEAGAPSEPAGEPIDETVPFEPLEDDDDDAFDDGGFEDEEQTAVLDAVGDAEPAGSEAAQAAPPPDDEPEPQGPRSPRGSSAIPPASEAAHRRHDHDLDR